MFNLENFKNYGGFSPDPIQADDSLDYPVLYCPPVRRIKWLILLGIKHSAPAGKIQRADFNLPGRQGNADRSSQSPVNHRFIVGTTGLRFRRTGPEDIVIAGATAKMNIHLTALQPGEAYNQESGPPVASIPAIPEAESLLWLGAVGGVSAYGNLPTAKSIDLAVFSLALYFFENRSFLKKELKSAVVKNILGILDPFRSVSSFMPARVVGAESVGGADVLQ